MLGIPDRPSLVGVRWKARAVGDAAIALDWKFSYDDGHLGRWTTSNVTEFLLGWCPRKLSVSSEDCVTIPWEHRCAYRLSRAGATVLAMFARLAEFVGPGRRLTQNGNLSLADARELVRLLGTDDVVDERIGDKVYPIRSSVDLPVLRLLIATPNGLFGIRHVLHDADIRDMADSNAILNYFGGSRLRGSYCAARV